MVIGNSVTTIESHAFLDCTSLTEIVSLNTTPPTVVYSGFYATFNYVPKDECIVKVPAEAVGAYQAAKGWREFQNIVGI